MYVYTAKPRTVHVIFSDSLQIDHDSQTDTVSCPRSSYKKGTVEFSEKPRSCNWQFFAVPYEESVNLVSDDGGNTVSFPIPFQDRVVTDKLDNLDYCVGPMIRHGDLVNMFVYCENEPCRGKKPCFGVCCAPGKVWLYHIRI